MTNSFEVLLELSNPVNVFFVGAPSGTWLADFYRSQPEEFQRAFVVESDPEKFARLRAIPELAEPLHDPRFHWLVGLTSAELKAKFQEILGADGAFLTVTATEVVGASFDNGGEAAYYKDAMRAYRDAAVEHLLVAGDSSHDAFIGLMNMLRNLDTIGSTPGINEFFGKFAGKPCVVVSAGPSLDKNISLLTELQDRAVIICVDAVVKNLIARGIRPHFATVLERVNFSAKLFSGLTTEETARTIQLSVPVVMPSVYECWTGPKALLYRPYSHFEWLGLDKGTLYTGASSANMAFKAGVAMGCDPIILVGQDLAYGENDETHAAATPWGSNQVWIGWERRKNIMVKGNVAPLVATTKLWNTFRMHFEKDVAEFPGTVINATEGGAFIEGTKVMRLREAIDLCESMPFSPHEVAGKTLCAYDMAAGKKQIDTLRTDKARKTAETLDRTIKALKKLLALFADNSTERSRLPSLALAAYSELGRETLNRQSLYHVIQSSINRAVLEHYALGSRHHDVEELLEERIALHRSTLEGFVATAAKVLELYADLENARGRDLLAQNLGLLKTIDPPLARILEKEPPEANGKHDIAPEPVLDLAPHTLRVLLGVDLDRASLEKALAPSSSKVALVITERNPALLSRFLSMVDLNALRIDFHLWFAVGEVAESPLALAGTLPSSLVAASQSWPCFIRGHSPDDKDFYDLLSGNLIDQLGVQRRRGANPKPLSFLETFFGNLETALTLPSTRTLRDLRRGDPALLLFQGMGDEELDTVRRVGGSHVLIAASSALQELAKAGITPDAVAGPAQKDIELIRDGNFGRPPMAIFAPFSAGVCFDYPGPLALADQPKNFLDWVKRSDAPQFPNVGQSELTAIGLARHLGCEPIRYLGNPALPPLPNYREQFADWLKWCMVTSRRALDGAKAKRTISEELESFQGPELARPLWPELTREEPNAVAELLTNLRKEKLPLLVLEVEKFLRSLEQQIIVQEGEVLPASAADQWFGKELNAIDKDIVTLQVARPLWTKFIGVYLSIDPSTPPAEAEAARRNAYRSLLAETREALLGALDILRRAMEETK